MLQAMTLPAMLPLAVIDWHSAFFALFAALTCAFAIAVVVTSNVVRMAFYLTLSLGATAGLFFLAGSEFVGAMQFLIYVGGTLVLLIFGVMLTAQSNFVSMKTAAGEWVLAGVLGAALLLLLLRAALSVDAWTQPRPAAELVPAADVETTGAIGMGLVGIRVDKLDPNRPVSAMPNSLSGYLFPFVIVSMHLLVVLVGASYMARTKRRVPGGAVVSGARMVPPRPERRHSFAVHGGIVSGIVLNALLAVLAFTWNLWTPAMTDSTAPAAVQFSNLVALTPPWLPPALGILFGLNVLLLAIVWMWQRWAVLGLVAVPFVQAALVAGTRLGNGPALVLLIVMLLPVAALLMLLLKGGRNSAWSKME